jgi:hypothetical protein
VIYDVSIPVERGADKHWFAKRHAYMPMSRALRYDGGGFDDPNDNTTVCPVCSDEFQHPQRPQVVPGKAWYEAGWGGRGDLTVLPFWGECEHRWALCFGFHEGTTVAFVAVPR